ncbi:MAG: NDP-sugar synthase [Bdellovibrionaceae bacterium]|nr:NDP-sugar synthase [Bdellovibrionales bacterium]MCB9086145.1 NDP-sugar synthase [Pseudobdellovibrionaceae bacterium]
MRAMILAAGLGERLRPHTTKVAKPALPFLNLPLICYPWFHLQAVGAHQLVVNTHHCGESVKAAVEAFGLPLVKFIHETPVILGSGGGIKNAEVHLKGEGSFVVANGDEILIAPDGLEELWRHHQSRGNLATLAVCRHPEVGTKFGGVWCDSSGRVIEFGKVASSSKLMGYHYTGFMALSDRVFAFLPQDQASNILYDGLASGIRVGEKVEAFEVEGAWYETGSESDFLSASLACLNHLLSDDPLGASLKELHHHYGRVLLPHGSDVLVGTNCHIDPSAQICGPTLLGHGVQLAQGVDLKGFNIIGDGTVIDDGCSLESSVIGSHLQIPKGSSLHAQLRLI